MIAKVDFAAFSEDDLRKLALLELADDARGDGMDALRAFGRCVFDVDMPAHIETWFTEILGNLRVAITAPPESAKTTWGVIFICWWIGRHPWQTNIIVSSAADSARIIAEKVIHVIEFSERWKLAFPTVVPDKDAGWSREGWSVKDTAMDPTRWARLTATRKEPTLLYGGVGSSIINGKRVSGILWMDDIHDRESKTSDTVCQDTVEFVQDTALARAKDEAHVVIVQTRWNPRDVIAYVKTLPHFKVFEHPAIIRTPGQPDQSYWPAQWPMERLLRKLAEVGSIIFELVYQGNDQAAQGSTLKGEWLLPYRITVTRHFVRFFGIDFALKTESVTGTSTRDPDRFALAVIAHTGDMLVVEDGWAGRVGQGEAEEKIYQLADIYSPKMIYLETNAAGEAFYQTLIRRMLEQGKRLPLVGQKASKNKGERLMEMQPDFEFGRVRVSDAQSEFLNLFRSEWLGFGQKRVHDDTLDAVYWAWRASGHLLPASSLPGRRKTEQKVNPWTSLAQQHL